MPISPGQRLGPYEILSAIGAGGMGEVYRAKDTRLDRSVAIKILPAHVAERDGLRERFDREARAISSLNHAHICVLHDIGNQDGTDYLVMELCEGETLAARLVKGPMPMDRVLQYSIEISDALDKAHRKGITHRDLKPGNIMLTKSGVKLLDFGLAKLRQEESPLRDLSNQLTVVNPITSEGLILGTLQYMSPEQLEGKKVDGRADIFAFGAVVYEMATGKRAFDGENQASVMAAILERQPPPISSLQPMTPPALDRVVRLCLAKDPDDRWQTAGDLNRELKWISEGGSQTGLATPLPARATRARRDWLAWCLVAILGGSAALLGFLHFNEKPPAAPPAVRLQVRLPDLVKFTRSAVVVLSPDGLHVLFTAIGADGAPHIWIQDLGAEAARPLSETDVGPDAPPPFWSPDSRFIVFSGFNKVRKVDVLDGNVQDLCNKPAPVIGGSWSQQGVIIFGSNLTGLWKVSAEGGTALPLTTLDPSRSENEHELPTFLPDGKHFLYLRHSTVAGNSGIYVGSLDDPPERQSTKRVLESGYGVNYVAPNNGNPGRLLFYRDGKLMAQTFDADKLELLGDPSPVAQGINVYYETPAFSATSNVLAFREAAAANQYQLTWFDSKGAIIGKAGDQGEFLNRMISPDGTRLVFSRPSLDPKDRDLWVLDLARGTTMRFTFGPSSSDNPVWSPDGKEIVFSSNRDGVYNLYRKPADGSQPEQLLLRTNQDKQATSWSRDGRFLFYESGRASANAQMWVLPMVGNAKPTSISSATFDEGFPQISPDGRWIAYLSDETGKYEVYVQEFKAAGDSVTTGGKILISQSGGVDPMWSADGKQIVYVGNDNDRNAAEAVKFDGKHSPPAGAPRTLFLLPTDRASTTLLAPTADQKRFLLPVADDSKTPRSFTVVVNWLSALTPK
jgi:eukaryotic-like serine/threonine-protein kinase